MRRGPASSFPNVNAEDVARRRQIVLREEPGGPEVGQLARDPQGVWRIACPNCSITTDSDPPRTSGVFTLPRHRVLLGNGVTVVPLIQCPECGSRFTIRDGRVSEEA